MTKGELISFLHSYSQAYGDYVDCARYIEKLLKRIKTLKGTPAKPNSDSIPNKKVIQYIALGIFIAAAALLLFLCFQVLNPLDISQGAKLAISLVVTLVIPGVLILVAYDRYMNALLNKRYKLILKQHIDSRSEIPALENQLLKYRQLLKTREENLKRYERQGILPEKYRTGGYAGIFCSYLEEGRADTLKEAINLWNLEEHQFAMREEQRRHNQEMELHQRRQADLAAAALEEAERATESQEATRRDVNFWGVMNYLKDDK